jgi:hypothetical protein
MPASHVRYPDTVDHLVNGTHRLIESEGNDTTESPIAAMAHVSDAVGGVEDHPGAGT